MTKIVKLASLSAAALIGVTLISGCTDQTARDQAQAALDKANAAQACCDTNTERLNAMYQKTMRK
jgi:outer membrane murein-binding lipoprotein Lpp